MIFIKKWKDFDLIVISLVFSFLMKIISYYMNKKSQEFSSTLKHDRVWALTRDRESRVGSLERF